MEVIKKINSLYERSLKEKFFEEDFSLFKKLVSDYRIRERMKLTPSSKDEFYSWKEPSKPYFITLAQRSEFSRITKILLNIFEKLTSEYFLNNGVRNYLSVSGRVSNYLNVNPGYLRKILIARFDAFYNYSNNDLKILEMNCDIPGGVYSDMQIKLFDQLPSMEYIRNEFKVCGDAILDSLCKMLLKRYEEYCLNFQKDEQKNPHIAIVCTRNSESRLEIELIAGLLKEKGLHVSYADPREFIYNGKTLKVNNQQVDIVYRRENTTQIFRTESSGKIHSRIRNRILNLTREACLKNSLINQALKEGYFGHTEDIIQAYADNNVCMINPFHSRICVQKLSFALVQEKSFQHLFNEEEKDAINKFIPWTRILKPVNTLFHDKEIELIPFLKINKDKFVLKPNMGYGGKGIIIGSEINQLKWERKIDLITASKLKYVVQEYIDIPTEKFPVYKNEKLKGFFPQYFNINFWGIDGEYAGSFIRICEKKVINVSQGGRIIPVYYVLN